ncbi:MAG: alpha/beta fold hydrolase [Caldilineaceae bacterium]
MTNTKRTTQSRTQSTTQPDGVTTGYADVHDARLYYEMAGTGETVVFLHAGIADRRMWDTQFYNFAKDYQVLRYDIRGYGNSTVGEAAYVHAQDLYLLLRALDIETATLVGCSLGGTTALDFALEQPTIIKALVLVNAVPSGFDYTGAMPPTLQAFVGACQTGNLAQAAELATQLWLDGPQRRPDQVDADLRAQVRTMIGEVLATGAVDFTGAHAAAQPALDRLAEITVPTLVIVGAQDDESIQRAGDLLVDRIPAADWTKIERTAHLPSLERPDAFDRILFDFLQRIEEIDETISREDSLATGLGGAVPRKVVAPRPEDQ